VARDRRHRQRAETGAATGTAGRDRDRGLEQGQCRKHRQGAETGAGTGGQRAGPGGRYGGRDRKHRKGTGGGRERGQGQGAEKGSWDRGQGQETSTGVRYGWWSKNQKLLSKLNI